MKVKMKESIWNVGEFQVLTYNIDSNTGLEVFHGKYTDCQTIVDAFVKCGYTQV